MAIKASVGTMLLRVSVKQSHKIALWTTIIITELYSLFFFFVFLLQCSPSAYFWTRFTGGTGSCMRPAVIIAAMYGYSIITSVGDWTFSIFPVFLVWRLEMGRGEKFCVILILSMGAL
jgi:hypothetical protein